PSLSIIAQPPPLSPLFPYTTLFRSAPVGAAGRQHANLQRLERARARLLFLLHLRPLEHRRIHAPLAAGATGYLDDRAHAGAGWRSEEHTSELQSHLNLVCRLLLEKK